MGSGELGELNLVHKTLVLSGLEVETLIPSPWW